MSETYIMSKLDHNPFKLYQTSIVCPKMHQLFSVLPQRSYQAAIGEVFFLKVVHKYKFGTIFQTGLHHIKPLAKENFYFIYMALKGLHK